MTGKVVDLCLSRYIPPVVCAIYLFFGLTAKMARVMSTAVDARSRVFFRVNERSDSSLTAVSEWLNPKLPTAQDGPCVCDCVRYFYLIVSRGRTK